MRDLARTRSISHRARTGKTDAQGSACGSRISARGSRLGAICTRTATCEPDMREFSTTPGNTHPAPRMRARTQRTAPDRDAEETAARARHRKRNECQAQKKKNCTFRRCQATPARETHEQTTRTLKYERNKYINRKTTQTQKIKILKNCNTENHNTCTSTNICAL